MRIGNGIEENFNCQGKNFTRKFKNRSNLFVEGTTFNLKSIA